MVDRGGLEAAGAPNKEPFQGLDSIEQKPKCFRGQNRDQLCPGLPMPVGGGAAPRAILSWTTDAEGPRHGISLGQGDQRMRLGKSTGEGTPGLGGSFPINVKGTSKCDR